MLRASKLAVTPAIMVDGVDRWVLASLLQKAIRRGQTELALGAALKLLELDPSRLWRRLMTVALEDVGVGDLDVALDLVAISALPVARRLLGAGQASLEILIPLACRAIKDRTADHLASLRRWQKLSGDRGSEKDARSLLCLLSCEPGLAMSSAVTLQEAPGNLLQNTGPGVGTPASYPLRQMPAVQPRDGASQKSWQDHIQAGLALAGTWEWGKLGIEEVLDYFGRLGAPAALLEASRAYGRRCGDSLFIYALAAWIIWAKQKPEPLALARQGLEGQELAGLPDYALDPLRTRLGRRAIELWLRSYLEKVPFDSRQVTAGLWNGEAALCNQTLFWEAGIEIQRAAYQADLLVQGLAGECHGDLMAWISREHSVLLCARQMVWQSHLRSLRRPAGPNPGQRNHGDGDGGGAPAGKGAGAVPSSGTAINSNIADRSDSSSARSVIEVGQNDPAPQDPGGPSWPDPWDDEGDASHHTIHTPYIPDEELCLAQS